MGNLVCCKEADTSGGWKQQSKQQAANTVYQYVNLQKGGKLVDIFTGEEGAAGVHRVISEELDRFMYRHGKGKVVCKIDYVKFRQKATADAMGAAIVDGRTDEEILSSYVDDHFITFEDHEACWDINMRGAVGETPFHLCILGDTPVLNEITKIMLAHYPKLALDIYEGPEYYGESSLHIAIVNGDFEMVCLLVENGANVNQRASGCFFLPEDQKKKMTNHTNYEGYAYYGEYPLSFAACFGHEEIYDYLIDHGADPNLQDSFGNTVLHMVVVSNQIGMYRYAIKHHAKKANVEIVNNANLTPLTLASKLGRNDIFQEVFEQQSAENWRYSNITCATYPLAPIDTIGPKGKINRRSALIYLTDGGTDEHLDMLTGGVINQLVNEKWKTYARKRFFQRLALACLHLVILSVAIYTRPSETPTSLDNVTIVRYVAEVVVCINCIINQAFLIIEIQSQGFYSFYKNQTDAPAKVLFNISCLIILCCIPVRLLKHETAEMVLLSLAAPCAWAILLFFARGASLFGPFVIMIYQMCASDMFRFVIIFIVFLLQFSQGFYFLFKNIDNQNVQSFKTPGGTVMQLFQMTLGEFKYDDFEQTRMAILTKMMFGLFAIFVPILLLNMLIAMMGNTYQLISSRAEKEWYRQWAMIIIVLERSFTRKELLLFQQQYSVDMVDANGCEARGLMVIKATGKTKAKQRKGAISNWKRVANEIKDLIKETKSEGKVVDVSSEQMLINTQQNRKGKTTEAGNDCGRGPTEGLMMAMKQLAWEKDIDFRKAQSIPMNHSVDVSTAETLTQPTTEPVTVLDLDSSLDVISTNVTETQLAAGDAKSVQNETDEKSGFDVSTSEQRPKKRKKKRKPASPISRDGDDVNNITCSSSVTSLLKAWDNSTEGTS